MCFSSLRERQLHNEKKKGGKKSKIKDLQAASEVWMWTSVNINPCFCYLVDVSSFLSLSKLPPSPVFFFFSIFFWCGCTRFSRGYMSHLFPAGVTASEPSSHCVHPKFPFQDVSYSKPYLVKNKPQTIRWDLEEKLGSGERGGGTGMKWTDGEKLLYASFDSSWDSVNVTDCARRRRLPSPFWHEYSGGQILSSHTSVSHLNTSRCFDISFRKSFDGTLVRNVTYTEQTASSMVPIRSRDSGAESDQLARTGRI